MLESVVPESHFMQKQASLLQANVAKKRFQNHVTVCNKTLLKIVFYRSSKSRAKLFCNWI